MTETHHQGLGEQVPLATRVFPRAVLAISVLGLVFTSAMLAERCGREPGGSRQRVGIIRVVVPLEGPRVPSDIDQFIAAVEAVHDGKLDGELTVVATQQSDLEAALRGEGQPEHGARDVDASGGGETVLVIGPPSSQEACEVLGPGICDDRPERGSGVGGLLCGARGGPIPVLLPSVTGRSIRKKLAERTGDQCPGVANVFVPIPDNDDVARAMVGDDCSGKSPWMARSQVYLCSDENNRRYAEDLETAIKKRLGEVCGQPGASSHEAPPASGPGLEGCRALKLATQDVNHRDGPSPPPPAPPQSSPDPDPTDCVQVLIGEFSWFQRRGQTRCKTLILGESLSTGPVLAHIRTFASRLDVIAIDLEPRRDGAAAGAGGGRDLTCSEEQARMGGAPSWWWGRVVYERLNQSLKTAKKRGKPATPADWRAHFRATLSAPPEQGEYRFCRRTPRGLGGGT